MGNTARIAIGGAAALVCAAAAQAQVTVSPQRGYSSPPPERVAPPQRPPVVVQPVVPRRYGYPGPVVVVPAEPVPPPNAVWVPGHWEQQGNMTVWVEGYWAQPSVQYPYQPQ